MRNSTPSLNSEERPSALVSRSRVCASDDGLLVCFTWSLVMNENMANLQMKEWSLEVQEDEVMSDSQC